MIAIMRQMGFPDKWLQWMEMLFSSGNSAVLLNGVPGKQFKCKRGVRQGDPLSPLLFVLAAELLQVIINKAFQEGLLSAPLPQAYTDFPIVQYGDDTLLVMQADAPQLLCLKDLLNTFADSTGLRVNYSKSQMIPINLSPQRAESLALTFGCELGTMPFTYLPHGHHKTKN